MISRASLEKFRLRDIELDYVTSGFNDIANNNRTWEVPLGFWFVNKYKPCVIEVGAVLPWYPEVQTIDHRVYDPLDEKGTHHEFAENLDYNGKNVLSISTIEHIGNGDYGISVHENLAIWVLDKIISESNIFLITFPRHHNALLTNYVCASKLLKPYLILFRRREPANLWDEDKVPATDPMSYVGLIYILTNDPELA